MTCERKFLRSVLPIKQICVCSLNNMHSILHLVVPLQFSSGEEPADADGPRGRHESGHHQVQQPLQESEQTAAAETPGDFP